MVRVHLAVSDMKTSIDFYTTELGFYYDHGIRQMAWLTRGNLLLTLSPDQPDLPFSSYFGFNLSSAGELEKLYVLLHQRHLRMSGPPDPASGRVWFYLYDPDGYPISFSCHRLEMQQGAPG